MPERIVETAAPDDGLRAVSLPMGVHASLCVAGHHKRVLHSPHFKAGVNCCRIVSSARDTRMKLPEGFRMVKPETGAMADDTRTLVVICFSQACQGADVLPDW